MRSYFAPGLLVAEHPSLPPPEPAARVRTQPFARRIRLGLQLVDRASAALPSSPARARELAATALSNVVPSRRDERRSMTRHLLPIAADVAATACCVEAESWLLEGRSDRAQVPATLARLLAEHGSGDPLVFGRLATMLALRSWLLGDIGTALCHLEAALGHYAEAGEPRLEAEVRARAAIVGEQAGLSVNPTPDHGI